ncbi:hypothetical protein F4703DRAFT_1871027 [Phycomyces blakesleeanus]
MYCDKPLRLYIVPDQALQSIRVRSDISMAERGEYYPGTDQDILLPPLSMPTTAHYSQPIETSPTSTPTDTSTLIPILTPTITATSNRSFNNASDSIRSMPRYRASDLMNAIRRIRSTLDLFAVFWFLLGNYFLFTSTTCEDTAGPIYYLSLSFIIYGYIIIAFPFILCAAVVFCLPCVLVGMHLLHVDDAVEMGGATIQEISLLPMYQFKTVPIPMKSFPSISQIYLPQPLPHHHNNNNNNNNSINKNNDQRQQKQQNFKLDNSISSTKNKPQVKPQSVSKSYFDLFWVWVGAVEPVITPSQPEPKYPTINIPPEQDRLCVICLSNYEDGDILCKLWCKHHFHKACVSEWLVLNSKCPMCKRDCRCKPDHTSTSSTPSISNHFF